MQKLTTIAATMLLTFSAAAEPEIKGTPSEIAAYLRNVPKLTSITGEAELRVPAQRAVVTLKVVTDSKSLQDSLRNNQDVRARIAEQLRKRDLPADRIQTSKFSSTPKYGMFGEKAKSYRVENSLRVTVQDEKEFYAVAGLVDQWAEVQFAGVEHEYADKESLKEKALQQACENAAAKKALYEKQFGVELTAVSFRPGQVAALNEAGNYGAYSNLAYKRGTSMTEAAGVPVAGLDVDPAGSSLGELIYTAHVAVEYSVQPKQAH